MNVACYQNIFRLAIMKDLNLIEEEMSRIGWSIIGKTLSDEDINFFRDDVVLQKKLEVEKYGAQFLHDNNYLDILKFQLRMEPHYVSLFESQWLNAVVDAVLDEAVLHDFNAIVNIKDNHTRRNEFHRDQMFLGKRSSIIVLIPLVDFTEEVGPTEIVSGSHLIESKPSQEFCESNHTKILVKAGSVILMDSCVWHRAGDNKSNIWRPTLLIRYHLPILKTFSDYSGLDWSNYFQLSETSELIKRRLVPPKSEQWNIFR
jgi:hypothetical protein